MLCRFDGAKLAEAGSTDIDLRVENLAPLLDGCASVICTDGWPLVVYVNLTRGGIENKCAHFLGGRNQFREMVKCSL